MFRVAYTYLGEPRISALSSLTYAAKVRAAYNPPDLYFILYDGSN